MARVEALERFILQFVEMSNGTMAKTTVAIEVSARMHEGYANLVPKLVDAQEQTVQILMDRDGVDEDPEPWRESLRPDDEDPEDDR